jgi:vacuolar-type H+-ATPase subunit D/Vma8
MTSHFVHICFKQSVVTFGMRAENDRQKAVVACVNIMGFYIPVLWALTFQHSNVMGCHVPTFQYYGLTFQCYGLHIPILCAVTFQHSSVMGCHIPTFQCYGLSRPDIPILWTVTFQCYGLHIPILRAVTFQHSNVMGCHVPTFRYHGLSHSNIMGCHVPTFRYYGLSHSDISEQPSAPIFGIFEHPYDVGRRLCSNEPAPSIVGV